MDPARRCACAPIVAALLEATGSRATKTSSRTVRRTTAPASPISSAACSAIRAFAPITARGRSGAIATTRRSRPVRERVRPVPAAAPAARAVAARRPARTIARCWAASADPRIQRRVRRRSREAEREHASTTTRRFNDFFTRELADGGGASADRRPSALVSPADGVVSQLGTIDDGRLLQAKGIRYPLASLLGRQPRALRPSTAAASRRSISRRRTTTACTCRSPARWFDPSRFPGELFSVNARTEAGVERLFCRNERLVLRVRHRGRSARARAGRRADRGEHRDRVRGAAVAVSRAARRHTHDRRVRTRRRDRSLPARLDRDRRLCRATCSQPLRKHRPGRHAACGWAKRSATITRQPCDLRETA